MTWSSNGEWIVTGDDAFWRLWSMTDRDPDVDFLKSATTMDAAIIDEYILPASATAAAAPAQRYLYSWK